jgi:hypothetical protein
MLELSLGISKMNTEITGKECTLAAVSYLANGMREARHYDMQTFCHDYLCG